MILSLLGATLLAFGVAGLYVIARRSVSLDLLRALRSGTDSLPAFEAAIAARLSDARRWGLVREERGQLVATRRGRAVARAVQLLRRGCGVRAR